MRGSTVVWTKDPYPDVIWPNNYYYPIYPDYAGLNGMSFWKNSVISGQTYSIAYNRTDDEGEGGGGYRCVCTKDGYYEAESERFSTSGFTPRNNYSNAWLNIYDNYTISFDSFGDFNGGTAIAYSSQYTYGGNGCHVPTTGVNWDNIELAVNTTRHKISPNFDDFNGAVVEKCPNLKYIAFNKSGEYTGSTINLRNSTAWTADSMKFTVKYSPGTTFIVENNSWWRSRIPFEMAQYYNVTFKDGNGNIIQ